MQSGPGGGEPKHTSHASHGFEQLSTLVQLGHFDSSARSASVHVDSLLSSIAPIHTSRAPTPEGPAFCSVQHPKQSQPFGVKGMQTCAHSCSCVAGQSFVPTLDAS
jgi:hypothetical protein